MERTTTEIIAKADELEAAGRTFTEDEAQAVCDEFGDDALWDALGNRGLIVFDAF